VFTIGHGTRAIGEFIAILRSAGVRRLVDVRTAPGSRKHPQFGKATLEASLEDAGIEYVWRQDLGGWRKPTPGSPHSALRSPGFRGYADHMDSDEFGRALNWLIETSGETPTAIMCAESLWWRCHRRMVSDALGARGCNVVHLMGDGARAPHRIHPSARIAGSRVVYDVVDPEQQELPS
jgi:uncharacterized protein (DUF488 family)